MKVTVFWESYRTAHLLTQVHGAEFGRLHPGVHQDIKHGANGLWNAEVRGPAALLELGLKCCSCSAAVEHTL